MGVQQDGDDVLLLLGQLRPQAVLQGLLFLPLEDQLPLPLHLFISQDDCGAGRGSQEGSPAAPPRNLPPGVKARDGRGCASHLELTGPSSHGDPKPTIRMED